MDDFDEIKNIGFGVGRLAKATINPFPLDDYEDIDRLEVAKRLLESLTHQADFLDHDDKGELLDVIDVAACDLSRTKNGENAMGFYLLGVTVGYMSNPLRDFDALFDLIGKGLDAMHGEEIRSLPIKMRNLRKEYAKDFVRRFVASVWRKPEYQDLRIAEMAEHIWNSVYSMGDSAGWLKRELPDKASGLIPWLREVAPESARKPGRPSAQKEK